MAAGLSAFVASFDRLRYALERIGARYAIGGSWASTAFGEPRFTNDVDILADLTPQNLDEFLRDLPATFYVDAQEASAAIQQGRSFNLIETSSLLKFDLFPARAFPLGLQELDRAISISSTELSEAAVPFVTPEDILLAKLYWFRSGGDVSEVQWRDIEGIVSARGDTLDLGYLERGAATLEVTYLLRKLLT